MRNPAHVNRTFNGCLDETTLLLNDLAVHVVVGLPLAPVLESGKPPAASAV